MPDHVALLFLTRFIRGTHEPFITLSEVFDITAKLNKQVQQEITYKYAAGAKQRELATQYGVTQATISRALGGLTSYPDSWDRFYSHVDVKSQDECWEWNCKENTHGKFHLDTIEEYAHRASYKLHTGKDIPDGASVRHRCHNVRCVNPKHLYIKPRSCEVPSC